MNPQNSQGGHTLIELLIGLAIAAMIMLPLADMLHTGADSARLVRTRIDLNADAGFALDRIAASAARAAVPAAPPPGGQTDWLKLLGFELCPDSRELLEAAACSKPERSSVVAAHVERADVTAQDTAAGGVTLRIALTLRHPDEIDPVMRARTVRVGAYR